VSSPLKSLSITAFRGSSQTLSLEFEKSRKLTLVYGENGTGKTTICDALEFLANGEVGSLKNKGLGSGLAKYFPTAGKSAEELEISLVTATGACSAKLSGSSAVVDPLTLCPKVRVLRRQQILKLVEASAGDRYNEIKAFIDIEGFEKSEQTLRMLVDQLGKERKTVDELHKQSLESLSSLAPQSGPSFDLLAWARAEAGRSQDQANARAKQIGTIRAAAAGLTSLPERWDTAEAKLADVRERAVEAQTAFDAAVAAAGAEAGELVAVLQAGLTFVRARPTISECPLCESTDKTDELATRIEQRIRALEGLRRAQEQAEQMRGTVASAAATCGGMAGELKTLWARLKEAVIDGAGAEVVAEPEPLGAPELKAWLTRSAGVFERWADEEARCRSEGERVRSIGDALKLCDLNQAKLEEIDRLKPHAERALVELETERKAFTETRIGEIAKAVGGLYEQVHPGEGLDKISLPLDPKKRASLEMMADFGGAERPPQAYFSQSHLDTLALCVFLALALREKTDDVILVMDDVLGSVDEPHVDRVIEMIYDVSQKFRHTVLTTHYRPWREKFRYGHLKRGDCQFVELTGWTLEEGVKLGAARPETERLRSLLTTSDFDAQLASGKSGVLLEAMLDHLTLKYGCAVPRKFGEAYTLGDLLPAVNGKLLKSLRVEVRDPDASTSLVRDVELAPILDELAKMVNVRNAMGAHFKAIGQHLTDADAKRFGELVLELADALICPTHGWPARDKSGSYWSNGGDTRRLHPLKKPA
jgi:energy-coupling factor transporter ATP-binding protein EcfA2